MTLKEQIKDLESVIMKLDNSNKYLRNEMRDLRGFMVESQLSITKNMKDLHDRLNYIKEYIGIDAFYEAIKNDRNNPPL